MAWSVMGQAARDSQMVGSREVVAMKVERTPFTSMAATSLLALVVIVLCVSLGL